MASNWIDRNLNFLSNEENVCYFLPKQKQQFVQLLAAAAACLSVCVFLKLFIVQFFLKISIIIIVLQVLHLGKILTATKN